MEIFINDEVSSVFAEEFALPMKLDKAGYFVILPIPERKIIHIERYNYGNILLHVLEGASARSSYLKIIEENWVSELSHAAYLAKELAKAELNLAHGLPYHQDAALPAVGNNVIRAQRIEIVICVLSNQASQNISRKAGCGNI